MALSITPRRQDQFTGAAVAVATRGGVNQSLGVGTFPPSPNTTENTITYPNATDYTERGIDSVSFAAVLNNPTYNIMNFLCERNWNGYSVRRGGDGVATYANDIIADSRHGISTNSIGDRRCASRHINRNKHTSDGSDIATIGKQLQYLQNRRQFLFGFYINSGEIQ